MLAAILSSVITMIATLISARVYYTKKTLASIDKHNKLVKPIADEAFREGFDQGWAAAITDPTTVKLAHETLFPKY